LPRSSATGTNFGGFIGYNSQWENLILGVLLAYNLGGNMSTQAADTIARSYQASDGYLYNVNVTSRAAMTFKDYGTFRARAAYVMGRFLPFAQIGGAIARANLRRSVNVDLTGVDADPANPPVPPPVALSARATDGKKDAVIYGVTAGLGVDVGITENIFLRPEYEYIHYLLVQSMTVDISTGRLGVAMKS